MTDTTFTPNPGSRLDAVAQAEQHTNPPTPASTNELVPSDRFVVSTRSDIPEEAIPRTQLLSASNPYLMILPRDMERGRAVILAIDNDIVLAESKELAQQVATYVAGSGSASGISTGMYLSKGVPLTLTSRSVLWAVATTYTTTTTTTGGASNTTTGSQTSPSAGTVITSQALTAGTYTVAWQVQLSGSDSATDTNNFGLYNGATLVATSLNTGAAGTYPQPSQAVVIPGGGATLAVKAIATGTLSSVYTAQLTETPVSATSTGAGVSRVSVLVERYADALS